VGPRAVLDNAEKIFFGNLTVVQPVKRFPLFRAQKDASQRFHYCVCDSLSLSHLNTVHTLIIFFDTSIDFLHSPGFQNLFDSGFSPKVLYDFLIPTVSTTGAGIALSV
jgi:hypothetical protein